MNAPAQVPATERWAGFASGLAFGDVPPDVVGELKGLVLDTAGCALAATALGDGRDAVRSLSVGGAGEATLWGWGGRSSAVQAAFANGALAHALNFDANGVQGGHVGLASVVAPLVGAEWMAGRGRLTSPCSNATVDRPGKAVKSSSGRNRKSGLLGRPNRALPSMKVS